MNDEKASGIRDQASVDAQAAHPGPQAEPVGVQCPACGCRHLPVQYTRSRFGGKVVRCRICRNCGKRILTVERVV